MKPLAFIILSLVASVASGAGLVIAEITFAPRHRVNPQTIVALPDERLFFTDATFTQVGTFSFSPAGVEVDVIKLVDPTDPTILMKPQSAALAPDNTVVFTGFRTNDSGSPIDRSFVGRYYFTGPPRVEILDLPTGGACRDILGTPGCPVSVAPDGTAFITENQVNRIAKVNRFGPVIEFPVAGRGLFMVSNTLAPDGTLVSADRVGGSLIRTSTSDGVSTRIEIPRVGTQFNSPWGITAAAGRTWYADSSANGLGALDPAPSTTITKFDFPAGSQPFQIASHPTANFLAVTLAGTREVAVFDFFNRNLDRVAVPAGVSPGQITFSTFDGKPRIYFNAIDLQSRDYRLFGIDGFTVPPGPNLTVSKEFVSLVGEFPFGLLSYYRAGDEAKLRLTVKNDGDAATTGEWVVSDPFPPCLEYVEAIDNSPSCTWNPTTRVLRCARSSELASGKSVDFVVRVRMELPELCTNVATVSGGGDATPGTSGPVKAATLRSRESTFRFVSPNRFEF